MRDYELKAEELLDPNLEGVFETANGKTMFDRRYSVKAIESSWFLSPRNADLNLIGPEIVEVPEELLEMAKVGTRASVKMELLRRGLPGVNV